MDKHTYRTLHSAADRLVLEAARRATVGQEASIYIVAYDRVMNHLIDSYEVNEPKED